MSCSSAGPSYETEETGCLKRSRCENAIESGAKSADMAQLRADKQALQKENAALKDQVKRLKIDLAAAKSGGKDSSTVVAKLLNPAALQDQVSKLKQAMAKNLEKQMAYKPSLKHGKGAIMTAEIPNVSEQVCWRAPGLPTCSWLATVQLSRPTCC